MGFASSSDGTEWDYFAENPVIHSGAPWSTGDPGDVYRPKFIGYLGENESNEHEYLVAWSETDGTASIIYSTTTDFKTFERDPRGYALWGDHQDGIVSAFREGEQLYLFTGKSVHTMNLAVVPEPSTLILLLAGGLAMLLYRTLLGGRKTCFRRA